MPRYVSIAEQTSWDEPNSSASEQTFFDIASEDISPENNIIEYETAATRAPPGADVGPYRSTGSFETFLETSAVGEIFKHAFGSEEVTSSGATASHVFEPVSAESDLPYFTALVHSDYPTGHRVISNAAIEGIEIAAETGELIALTVDVVGREEIDPDNQGPEPSYSCVPFATFVDGHVKMRGTSMSANAESFSVTFENDIDTDALVLGRRDLPAIRLQGQTVEGTIDLAFDNYDVYNLFMGDANSPQDHASGFEISFECTLDSSEVPELDENHELNVYVPQAYIDTTEANIDTRDRIVQSVDFIGVGGCNATKSIDGEDFENSILVQLVNERGTSY